MMKKMTLVILSICIYNSPTKAVSVSQVANFILNAADSGMNGKKVILPIFFSSVYYTFSKEESWKKKLLRGVGIMLVSATICGALDCAREHFLLKAWEHRHQQYKEIIQQYDKDIAAINAERHKNAVKRTFYKMLVDHENEPCEIGSVPESCQAIAQEFRTLWGEELYQKEIGAFHRLRGKMTKKIHVGA